MHVNIDIADLVARFTKEVGATSVSVTCFPPLECGKGKLVDQYGNALKGQFTFTRTEGVTEKKIDERIYLDSTTMEKLSKPIEDKE